MQNQPVIEHALAENRAEIVSLLQSAKLPTEDLPIDLNKFLVARCKGQLVGVIGIEQYGNNGLLRSMIVKEDFRNRHIATDLVAKLEENAKSMNIDSIYLLTETAAAYFNRKGYRAIDRSGTPDAIKQSGEFSSVCPVSAVVMMKPLL